MTWRDLGDLLFGAAIGLVLMLALGDLTGAWT